VPEWKGKGSRPAARLLDGAVKLAVRKPGPNQIVTIGSYPLRAHYDLTMTSGLAHGSQGMTDRVANFGANRRSANVIAGPCDRGFVG